MFTGLIEAIADFDSRMDNILDKYSGKTGKANESDMMLYVETLDAYMVLKDDIDSFMSAAALAAMTAGLPVESSVYSSILNTPEAVKNIAQSLPKEVMNTLTALTDTTATNIPNIKADNENS